MPMDGTPNIKLPFIYYLINCMVRCFIYTCPVSFVRCNFEYVRGGLDFWTPTVPLRDGRPDVNI